MVHFRVRVAAGTDTYRTVWLQLALPTDRDKIKEAARSLLALSNPSVPADGWDVLDIAGFSMCPASHAHDHP